MSALSAVMQLLFETFPLRIAYIRFDPVGMIWILAFFLFGLEHALSVSVITALFIAIASPTHLVGAAMKLIATTSMILTLGGLTWLPFFSEKASSFFKKPPVFVTGLCLAVSVRNIACLLVNYYWAYPTFVGSRWLEQFFFGSIPAFVAVVVVSNTVLGVMDFVVAWFLAFRTKLVERFGTW